MANGYIYRWIKQEGTTEIERGSIRQCEGSQNGPNRRFRLTDCSSDLQTRLQSTDNFEIERICPPPAGAIRVEFDPQEQGEKKWAVNIKEI